jgi:hypothetical protein
MSAQRQGALLSAAVSYQVAKRSLPEGRRAAPQVCH